MYMQPSPIHFNIDIEYISHFSSFTQEEPQQSHHEENVRFECIFFSSIDRVKKKLYWSWNFGFSLLYTFNKRLNIISTWRSHPIRVDIFLIDRSWQNTLMLKMKIEFQLQLQPQQTFKRKFNIQYWSWPKSKGTIWKIVKKSIYAYVPTLIRNYAYSTYNVQKTRNEEMHASSTWRSAPNWLQIAPIDLSWKIR